MYIPKWCLKCYKVAQTHLCALARYGHTVPNIDFLSEVFTTNISITESKLKVAVKSPCTCKRSRCINLSWDIVLRKHVCICSRTLKDRSDVADDAGTVRIRSTSLSHAPSFVGEGEPSLPPLPLFWHPCLMCNLPSSKPRTNNPKRLC